VGSRGFSRARGRKEMRKVEEVWCDSDLAVRFIMLVGGGAFLGHGASLVPLQKRVFGTIVPTCTR